MGFGVNRSVGQFAFLAVLLMPDAAAGAQQSTIDSDRSPAERARAEASPAPTLHERACGATG